MATSVSARERRSRRHRRDGSNRRRACRDRPSAHQRTSCGERRGEQHVERPPLQHKVGRVDVRLSTHDLDIFFISSIEFSTPRQFSRGTSGGRVDRRPAYIPPVPRLRPRKLQSQFRAAPKHVLRAQCPFLADQPIHFRRIEIRPEVLSSSASLAHLPRSCAARVP